jgi:hypothetical protein
VLNDWLKTSRERFALYRSRDVSHQAKRDREIRAEIAGLRGRPCYLVLGDSNVEACALQPASDLLPINAGMSGGTVHTFLFAAVGRAYVRLCRPSVVVVALGFNDMRRSDVSEFGAKFRLLLGDIAGPARIVLGISQPWSTADLFNREIGSAATEHQAIVSHRPQMPFAEDMAHYTPDGLASLATHIVSAVTGCRSRRRER